MALTPRRTRLYRELARKVCALAFHRESGQQPTVASQQTKKPSGFLIAIENHSPEYIARPRCGMPLPLCQRNRTVVHSTMVVRLAGDRGNTLSPSSAPPPKKKPVCPRSPRIVCCSSVATSYLQPKFKFLAPFLVAARSFAQKCFVFLIFPPLRVYSSR